MRLELLSHTPADGWSKPLPTHLDSESTLLLAFASTRFDEGVGPLRDLVEAGATATPRHS